MKSLALFAALFWMSSPAFAETIPFDAGWHFFRGDVRDAERPAFQDGGWAPVDLPHDWSIAGPFSETNPAGGAGAFLPSGVGWYRKDFTLPETGGARRVLVEFDGVMANSDVWINGHHASHRPSGYVSFIDDLTSNIFFGGRTNVLAVRVDVSRQPASRWYAGAGIYRHVRLLLLDPVHFEPWGIFLTEPSLNPSAARLRAEAKVVNDDSMPRDATVELTVLDRNGGVVARSVSPPLEVSHGGSRTFTLETIIRQPHLWNVDDPALYYARLSLIAGSAERDGEVIPIGLREFHFDPARGFSINGRRLKLKGVCLHSEGSCFGAAVPLDIWKNRLKTLRELGVNAIRTAHNPPAPEFLDLCDRLGFLVMDEFFDCWTVGKEPYDYHLHFKEWSAADERDTIRRDRNHPSVILYSVGNEIHDTPRAARARQILSELVAVCHETDPTRPVTQALFRPNSSGDYTNGLADLLDVIGTNYRDRELLAAQRARPSRKIIGTEERHDAATWVECRDHPELAGQFLWTGIDYLGESRRWPVVAAGSGLLDRCGWARPLAAQRQSWWSEKPMVSIARRATPEKRESGDPGFTPLDRRQTVFADWTPRETAPHDEMVEVYSNCREVELRLNGRSLGSRTMPSDASPAVWNVPFVPGELVALGQGQDGAVARCVLRTAASPARIVLTSDKSAVRPGWDSVAEVRAQIVDGHGVLVPDATNIIQFNVSGSGAVIAVDSADNSSHEPFQAARRRAFQGQCAAMVRATAGAVPIHLTAVAEGLGSGALTLQVEPWSSSHK